ncbi:MAG: UvrABC system protein A [Chlamydiae bacterium]|nr:UvrABC system protein A [Chlamydiota bacterium]
METKSLIKLKKVCVHNLKAVDLDIPQRKLVVMTGVSGSGKSSLAFDTVYVEGQRRYVESLSNFAKRQMGELTKPDMESASGISPTISIEQKTAGRNPRSTVGTMTQVHDYLRVLFARIGIPHCPISGEAVQPQSREKIIKMVQTTPEKTKIIVCAPFAQGKKGEFKEDFQDLLRKGFMRVRVDGNWLSLDEETSLDGNLAHDIDLVIDRIEVKPENKSRIADSMTQALQEGNGVCKVVNAGTEETQLFSMHAFSPKSGLSYQSLEPHDFSFNSPSGMCPKCHGLGEVNEFKLDLLIDPNKSIANDCCSLATSYQTVRYSNIYDNLARIFEFSVRTPWKKLSKEAQDIFLHGTPQDRWLKMHFVHPTKGYEWTDRVKWRGVLYEAHVRYQEAKSDRYRKKMAEQMEKGTCPECDGTRLKAYPAATRLAGTTISEVMAMTIGECRDFFENLSLNESELLIAEELLKEIRERLQFLVQVGLHYLTLDRTAPTLSGGEAQRVRLASQIGCGLVGITYVLDEPSIGLHPRDNLKLIETLKHLRDMGNTVLVVEHDEETILAADHVIDFGPGAGSRGGKIVVNGSLQKLLKSKRSLTAQYLRGDKVIPIPSERRKPLRASLKIVGASHHNLKNIDVKFPLGVFVCVTGVSGSGKSSLVSDILYPSLSNQFHGGEHGVGAHKDIKGLKHIDKVIGIDQSPIGRNPRSNPATYIKLFDDIRDLFAQLPESKSRGYLSGRFSFNVKEGSCTQCSGMGMIKIDMDFMEDAWTLCSLCQGKRFDSETLTVKFKGTSIYDVLDMDIDEAEKFFQNIPHIKHKLNVLQKVGLGYLKIGQFSTTLSGGEAQRVKLAKELVRPSTGKTLYILDEPTTGLHYHDVKHLLEVLHELVDRGNTVIVIEHNMEVVKTADWIIDLGPEGGAYGGEIVGAGTPEEIAKQKTPTGSAVERILNQTLMKEVHDMIKAPTHKKERIKKGIQSISVVGAEQNNLKSIEASIPRGKITICTGPSGSGKSSFAFDTVYAEGQRRYIESLSPYARQFVKQMAKPIVGNIDGLSPAISIEQKIHAGNPRSTIGTLTEIYDYLRILYARKGIPHCPETGEVIKAISKEYVVDRLMTLPEGTPLFLMAPVSKHEKFYDIIERFQRQGYLRIRLDGELYEIDEPEKIPYNPKQKHEFHLVIDRLKTGPSMRNRIFEGVESCALLGNNQIIIQKDQEDIFYNLSFSVESTGKSYPEITPHTFAFNTSEGMCPYCEGLGFQYGANLVQNPEIIKNSFIDLMYILWGDYFSEKVYEMLFFFLDSEGIDPSLPLEKQPSKNLQVLMNGSEKPLRYHGLSFQWKGLNHVLSHGVRSHDSDIRKGTMALMDQTRCIGCDGGRIDDLGRHVTINKKGIHEICQLPIHEALQFIRKIRFNAEEKLILGEIHDQLIKRLTFLIEVGLDYVSLDRSAPTLSGGEAQRIRLARQLGGGLTGTLYVLDEPTIGLHPRDTDRLNNALLKLKKLGNTLILVEHDPMTLKIADYMLDFGPQSGVKGGHIVSRGTLAQIKKDKKSLTGQYLSGKMEISSPKKRRIPQDSQIVIKNATLNNLKNVSVEIPCGVLTCVTGVSGSGKSTLIEQILVPSVRKGVLAGQDIISHVKGIDNFTKLISIDQNPIGHTVRSNVGTYVELLDRMREFFAQLPAARAGGLATRNFSYNHRAGMCTSCWGLGYNRVEMHFLPPVKVPCKECQGLRLNPVSLQIEYKNKNFGHYLQYTVAEARIAFENFPRITRILDTLIDVGLDYLKLGQEMVSLSGGEAQRIKLSRELSKRSHGSTLYVLDEPTIGLHSDDIQKLLKVLHRLVDKKNTMVIIEHNLDIIKNADHIIDLGPEAGEKGGEVIFTGSPEQIVKCKRSQTGKYLKSYK